MTADQDVLNLVNGSDGSKALPEALVARFYESNMFGRATDYAFPEGSNTTSSRSDSITSLDKNLDRCAKLADENVYDAFDMLRTCTKWVLSQNIHINDDEINSVNFKATK